MSLPKIIAMFHAFAVIGRSTKMFILLYSYMVREPRNTELIYTTRSG